MGKVLPALAKFCQPGQDFAPIMEQPRLYPFSFFDLMRRRWTRARYVASLDDLAARYDCFRIEDKPEIREGRQRAIHPARLPGATNTAIITRMIPSRYFPRLCWRWRKPAA